MSKDLPSIDFRQEDCLEGMKRLDAGSIDAVVTSPPYNLGVRYKTYDDNKTPDAYLDWMGAVADELARVLAPNGSIFLNVGGTLKDPWLPYDVASRFKKKFHLQNQILWVKSIAIPKGATGKAAGLSDGLAVGHFKPINSPRYLNHCYEFIFHFTHRGDVPLDRLAVGVPYQDKSNIGRWAAAKADARCRGNTWFIPYKTVASEKPHPATYPVALADMCLRLHGVSRINRVMDPFMGIGTTALACRALKVPFIGFEIDESYIQEAERLLKGPVPAACEKEATI